MKNLLIVVLFLLAAVGCGTSYMLLRMPRHSVTGMIVKWLAAGPEDPQGGDEGRDPVAAETAVVETTAAKTNAVAVSRTDDGRDWKGLTADNWYAGKRLSERDFRGKVALVYVWSSKEKPSVELLGRIEQIWASFRGKPLVVVGSHRGGRNPKIPKAYRQLELTFPMYEGAAFAKEPSVSHFPYIYIVNHHGKVVYRGVSDRSATESLVEALTACQLKQ